MNALKKVLVLLVVVLGFQFFGACSKTEDHLSPGPQSYSADVVTSWIKLQLKVTQTTPASPTITARRFAYASISGYEALVPGRPPTKAWPGNSTGSRRCLP